MPIISVVIPVYNVEKYLNECVESVLKQTYQDYEIILVDDGATDSSGRMCDAYSETDSRIRVIHQRNGGLSAARNTGLRASEGKYVYFLDSDDFIEETALKDLLDIAEEKMADVVFFDGYTFFDGCKEDPNVYDYRRNHQYDLQNGRDMLLELLANDEYRTAVPLMFLRRAYLEEHKLDFYEGILHEDELFTFLVYNANGRIAHCHEQLYARRMRAGSIMTASGSRRRFESFLLIYNELAAGYKNEKVSGTAARVYLVRTAKSVIGKYAMLTEEDQMSLKGQYIAFKQNVMEHKGFDDRKLQIKCSGKFMSLFYRGLGKFSS